MIAIKGHFDGKVIVPDQPPDLRPGQRVLVHVVDDTAASDELPRQSALQWAASHPASDLNHPPDGADQHDHYLYHTPKKPK
ncbi:MAG TPA: hypothetical protein VIL86_08325 [Tepidisphaeraceae bacterium]|jgi:hypothetical protein